MTSLQHLSLTHTSRWQFLSMSRWIHLISEIDTVYIIDTDRQTEVMKMKLRLRLFCSQNLKHLIPRREAVYDCVINLNLMTQYF